MPSRFRKLVSVNVQLLDTFVKTTVLCIGCGCIASIAHGQGKETESILQRLTAIDSHFESGITIMGSQISYPDQSSPLVPIIDRELALAAKGKDKSVHVKPVGEIFPTLKSIAPLKSSNNPSIGFDGTTYGLQRTQNGSGFNLSIPYETHLYFDANYSGALLTFRVFPLNEEGDFGSDFFSKSVNLSPPDSADWTLLLKQVTWCIGRGVSNYIDEIITIERLESDHLLVRAKGFESVVNRGFWKLEINPLETYIIRRADFFPGNTINNLESKPTISILNSGSKVVDGITYATSGEFTRNWKNGNRNKIDKFTFENIEHQFDSKLHAQARQSVFESRDPYTLIVDTRSTEPVLSEVNKLGEVVPLTKNATVRVKPTKNWFSLRMVFLLLGVCFCLLFFLAWVLSRFRRI